MARQLVKLGVMTLESLEVQYQHCWGSFHQKLLCGVGAHHLALPTCGSLTHHHLSIFWHAFAHVSDRGNDLQIQTVAANTLNKHYEVADKGSSDSLGVD